MQVPYRQNLAYARFCHSLRRARPFCRSATFSPFHRGNLPRGGSGRRNIFLNCLTKICLLLRKSKNFAVIVKKFIFKVFPKSAKSEMYRKTADIASSFGDKFLRRNGDCCKTVGIASSFGGSGGEADDRGQSGSCCKTANIAFFFGSMKNILFPFSGENSSVETGVVAKADIASSFGGKFLRRNGGCCKTAGIASSFGGSGGEADDRG